MQFYYGPQMPLRILDEAEFWKLQESEHTTVIKEIVTGLEKEFVDALNEWEKALSQTNQQVVSFIESVIRSSQYIPNQLLQQVLQLVAFCLEQSEQFIELCRQIRNTSRAASNNPIAKTVIDHIIRESEYFIGIARALLSSGANT